MPWEARKNGDQWCVYKKDGSTTPIKGGCHSTRGEALSQVAALYANYRGYSEGGEMQYLAFAEQAEMGDDGLLWVEALPAKTWYDPRYGDVPVDKDKLQNFIKNFDEGVRGQEITTDFEHGRDLSKGNKASGTYKKFEIRPRDDGAVSLWAGIEPTPTALNEIKNKEWKYFSLEWEDEWTHPETKEVHTDVVVGGGFTNRPVAKGMMPINFSEVMSESREFAVWSTAFVNSLPNSSFLYVEPGSDKNKSKRHLPYKDKSGKIDLPHLRNAIARIPQMTGVSSEKKSSLQAKARRLLASATKSMAEELEIDAEFPELIVEDGDPVPNDVNNNNDNDDKGGEPELTAEELQELRTITGIDEHGDVVAAVKSMSEELAPLREMKAAADAKKRFSEQYPEEAKRLEKLEKESQESFAKKFSESFEDKRVSRQVGDGDEAKTEYSNLGFSALVLDEIAKCAKEFSEGTPTFDGFNGVLEAIFNNGIVDYGNKGSDREPPEVESEVPGKDARKRFAEVVSEIQKKDELSFDDALVEASKRHPKLAEAWREARVPA